MCDLIRTKQATTTRENAACLGSRYDFELKHVGPRRCSSSSSTAAGSSAGNGHSSLLGWPWHTVPVCRVPTGDAAWLAGYVGVAKAYNVSHRV